MFRHLQRSILGRRVMLKTGGQAIFVLRRARFRLYCNLGRVLLFCLLLYFF